MKFECFGVKSDAALWKQIDGRRDKTLWRDLSFGSRKEGDFGDGIDTRSENSADLGEEVIYLDDIEEFVSPVIKGGGLQDQRFFVFRSFGSENEDETELGNSRKSRRKRSRRRSLIRRSSGAAYDDESDDDEISPQIRRKSHHQRVRSALSSQPQPRFFSVREANGVEKAGEFSSSRHLEKDDVAGKLALPSRAITMPCVRNREGDATETENINRSNSYPFSQSYDDYSPCRHIHPKLPDYDELAAKFMELKRANIEKKLDIKI